MESNEDFVSMKSKTSTTGVWVLFGFLLLLVLAIGGLVAFNQIEVKPENIILASSAACGMGILLVAVALQASLRQSTAADVLALEISDLRKQIAFDLDYADEVIGKLEASIEKTSRDT